VTEEEWHECTDASEMLEFLPGEPAKRKLMMFAAMCCLRMMLLVTDERLRAGIQCVQRLSEGIIQPSEAQAVCRDVRGYLSTQLNSGFDDPACSAVIEALERHSRHWSAAVSSHVKCAIVDPLIERGADNTAWAEEQREQCLIVRDIFGNPFRPVHFSSAWRTPNVLGIAQGIYEERAFERLPILADALMDAGCFDEEIIGHCHQPGEHVRGCWVVDLCLGKE
jgi:hypothetical protein